VLRAAVENRVELDRGNAEFLEVVEFVDHALQVTAVTAMKDAIFVETVTDGLLPLVADKVVPGPWRHPPPADIGKVHFEGLAGRVVGRIAVAEAFRENLIPDRRLAPFRHVVELGVRIFPRPSGGGQQRQDQIEHLH
jgi:hypothetical protein